MKIKSIRLKNGYKRFHDTTIDLGDDPPRIVALVGPNGCGKSSVLDGMLFLNGTQGGTRLGSTGRKGTTYHSQSKDRPIQSSDVIITSDQGNFIQIIRERIQIGKQGTVFSFRSPYRYNSALKITETKATSEIKLNPIIPLT